MRRGDIYTAATGSGFGSKPRPVLILQSELFETPAVLVALIDTPEEPVPLRPRVLPDAANGLEHESEVATDVIVAVRRHKFGYRIGRISDDDQLRVDRSLLLSLGFGD